MATREVWVLDMKAEPVIAAWTTTSQCQSNGGELQEAIINGFADPKNSVWSSQHQPMTFEKEFTFKEHGEFFRGALTMAGIRYTGDFYELLKRYEKIKVTIEKSKKVEN